MEINVENLVVILPYLSKKNIKIKKLIISIMKNNYYVPI